jgi:hypothetical protein
MDPKTPTIPQYGRRAAMRAAKTPASVPPSALPGLDIKGVTWKEGELVAYECGEASLKLVGYTEGGADLKVDTGNYNPRTHSSRYQLEEVLAFLTSQGLVLAAGAESGNEFGTYTVHKLFRPA